MLGRCYQRKRALQHDTMDNCHPCRNALLQFLSLYRTADGLRTDILKHREVDEEIATLAQGGRHGLIEGRDLDAHSMIGTVVQHGHEVAIAADQHDAVYGAAFD